MLALVLLLFAALPRVGAAEPKADHAVATEHQLATRVGLEQLRQGGSAADAAVASAFVAGVANPTSSGIGGGGFALFWDAANHSASALDFRESAPKTIDVAGFEQRPFASDQRGKWVGVPGEVAGLFELHRRHGKRTWAEVLAPAIDAAEHGFVVEAHLARALLAEAPALRRDRSLAAIFFPEQKAALAGTKLTNPALAHTLRQLVSFGPWGFYQGAVAADIIRTVRSAGGALEAQDLQNYRVSERAALHVTWEGLDVYTMPPPSAGGLMLAEVLGQFQRSELRRLGQDSPDYYHTIAEAMRGALADRYRYLGDPAFEKANIAALLDETRLLRRRQKIASHSTRAIATIMSEEHGTHHITAADSWGNAVALTTTVNRTFGAKLWTDGGFTLNDELDDFGLQRDAEAWGMKQNPNRPRPLARPVSSMTPTIVTEAGQVLLAVGGSGGMRIASNVTQAVLMRLVFGATPSDIVSHFRVSLPSSGATIGVEDTAPASLVAGLRARGENVVSFSSDTSAVQLIARDNQGYIAASDPRKSGLALAE